MGKDNIINALVASTFAGSKSGGGSGGTGTDDYEELINQPQINGIILTGNKTTKDLNIAIPEKVSELENDSEYQTVVQVNDIVDNKVNRAVSEKLDKTGGIVSEDFDLTAGGEISFQSTGVLTLDGTAGGFNLNGDGTSTITGLTEPQADNDAATKGYVDSKNVSKVIENGWMYKIYTDNTFEAWYKAVSQTITISAASGNLYRSELRTITLPQGITDRGAVNIIHAEVNAAHNNYPCWGLLGSLTSDSVNYYAMSGGSRSQSPNYLVTAYVAGVIDDE